MAETYVIEAQPRTITGKKVSQLRNQGLVPAVIYGRRVEPIHVQIPYRSLQVALMKAGGTHLIDIQMNGDSKTVITREVQRDILKGTILHVDFFAVDADTRISAEVPVRMIGESPAVLGRKGMLLSGLNSITIEVLPRDLISEIEVDLASLVELGDSIHVRDLNLGSQIIVKADQDELVARIIPLPTETEEATTEEGGAAEPEVIQKGKQEEEEF